MTRSPGGFKTVSSSGHIPATPRLEALTPQALGYSCATGKASKGTWTLRRERQVTPCRNQLSRVSSCDLRVRSWETAVLAKPLITCTHWIKRNRSGRSSGYWSADAGILRHDGILFASPACNTQINTVGTELPTPLPSGLHGDLSEDVRAAKFSGHSLRAGLASSAKSTNATCKSSLAVQVRTPAPTRPITVY